MAILGAAYSFVGRIAEAQIIVDELQELAEKAYVPSFAFAIIYSGMGEFEKALDWFEKPVNEQAVISHLLPSLDPLRSHPRYQALLRKMNLEA